MALGKVVDNLADCPPARTVARIKLRLRQTVHRSLQQVGENHVSDDEPVPFLRRNLRIELELPDGILKPANVAHAHWLSFF